jgi:serine/threonine protein kinase
LFGHLVQNIETTERFRQEALALASLSHPNIVTVHDLM